MPLTICYDCATVLQKKAEKFELKKLQDVEVTKEGVSTLETLLHDIYANRRPKSTDYQARKDLIRVFNGIAKEIYGNLFAIMVLLPYCIFWKDFVFASCSLLEEVSSHVLCFLNELCTCLESPI